MILMVQHLKVVKRKDGYTTSTKIFKNVNLLQNDTKEHVKWRKNPSSKKSRRTHCLAAIIGEQSGVTP